MVLRMRQCHGFFGIWRNWRNNTPFNDYKLFLFRNFANIAFLGCVHAVPQTSMRIKALRAVLLNDLCVDHRQIRGRKHRFAYVDQLIRGIYETPSWIRYYWFLGYYYVQKGDLGNGANFLEQAAMSRSTLFPVEALNAAMVLAEVRARLGQIDLCRNALRNIEEFLPSVRSDFEVLINPYSPWHTKTSQALESCDYASIKAPMFGY